MTTAIVPSPSNDFQPIITMVLDGLGSPNSRRAYKRALDDFLAWYVQEGKPGLTKAVVQQYKGTLEGSPASINQRMSAIRKLAQEAADNGLLDQTLANGVARVQGVKTQGVRVGNWLDRDEAQALLNRPNTKTLKGLRDRAILALMLGAGLRRSEIATLTFKHLQMRDARWVILDLVGKHGRVRTVPIAAWVKAAIDQWAGTAGLDDGFVFRPLNKSGKVSGDNINPQTVYDILAEYAGDVAPHDLRRTFAKLARKGGAELDQLQLTLGHSSVRTTQNYVGDEIDLHNAPSDHVDLK